MIVRLYLSDFVLLLILCALVGWLVGFIVDRFVGPA